LAADNNDIIIPEYHIGLEISSQNLKGQSPKKQTKKEEEEELRKTQEAFKTLAKILKEAKEN
jgi:hypothetical protein